MAAASVAEQLVRFEESGLGIYVWPDKPDWVVPNTRGDLILSRLLVPRPRPSSSSLVLSRPRPSSSSVVLPRPRPSSSSVVLDPGFRVPGSGFQGTISRGEGLSEAIEACAQRFGVSRDDAAAAVQQFARRLEQPAPPPYAGRLAYRTLDRLKECWLHITNRCNARCTHCMFGSSPADASHLATEEALAIVGEAARLGCELFYFTGGEPFVHDGFLAVCEHVLRETAAHLVILTNAVAARDFIPRMAAWSRERVHFQVSADGAQASHDAVRGRGAHARLLGDLALIRDAGFPVTLAMAVQRGNVADMSAVVALAAERGVQNVHYLWLFLRGNAAAEQIVPPEAIWPHLIAAAELAEARGVLIDNVEILKSQVFAIPGTRFDLSNAGWESLAVGPDGRVFPSPALIGHPAADCGHVRDGLESVWRTSPRLQELRASSVATDGDPLRFLVGGGDVDHSLHCGGTFTGADPYLPLYRRLALWLIAREAARFPDGTAPAFRLRMGDTLHQCPSDGDGVFFTHSNCVLSLPGRDGHALVRDFYARAAETPEPELCNPARRDDSAAESAEAHLQLQMGKRPARNTSSDAGGSPAALDFIPDEVKVRNYGCGSPVAAAGLREGDVVVDLGCGAGLECFIAASLVGPSGRVIGVDMLPQMLDRARAAAGQVAERLGYANAEFRQALLEELPLADASADVIVSNCVLNLSPQKRRAFQEMLRVLRPGGRIVIADVASETEIPIAIQYSERLRGECLGGAFQQDRLLQLLTDVGFRQPTILGRFPYRKVRGHQFFSLTYSATRPDRSPARGTRGGGFLLDEQWGVADASQAAACSCCSAPEGDAAACCSAPEQVAESACCAPPRRRAQCMVCGEPVVYLDRDHEETCHYCQESRPANAVCEAGHFVCDACHSQEALEVIERLLLRSAETDLIALLRRVRKHHAIPVHGPEHHSLVPAIIVAAFRNAGGDVADGQIRTAIQRGATVAGGACAFLGACGAATGVSAAFAILLGANPLKGAERQRLQRVTAEVLGEIAQFAAARCCQRECWLALRAAARLSRSLLPIPLTADAPLPCEQFPLNNECLGPECPLWDHSG